MPFCGLGIGIPIQRDILPILREGSAFEIRAEVDTMY
jgi:hypothetical protein